MATNVKSRLSVALAVVLASGVAVAAELKMPKDAQLPVGEGSPGPVTFSHESHVDAKSPSCVTCHPRSFSILQKTAASTRARITHDAMEKGKQSCGACHGGTAFGFDDCEMCHKG
jgi:c(7)-type cytochrome triheme protein